MTSITFLANSLALNVSEHFVAMSVQVSCFSTFLHMKISLLDDNIGIPELWQFSPLRMFVRTCATLFTFQKH